MYAIVRAGAKQQKVAVGDVIEIDKITTGGRRDLSLPVVLVVDGETITSDAAGARQGLGDRRDARRHQGPQDHHPEVQEQDRLQEAPGSPSEVHPGQGHRHLASELRLRTAPTRQSKKD